MQVIAEVIVGQPELGNAAWIGITAVTVAVAYGVAVVVPNIWPVMVRDPCSASCMFHTHLIGNVYSAHTVQHCPLGDQACHVL